MSNAVKHQMSVQTKINLAMLLVLGLLMLASLIYSANNERNLIQQVMEQRTRDTADTYFDFINTSMLTGTMAQRGILRDKILASPGIIEARIIRDEPPAGLQQLSRPAPARGVHQVRRDWAREGSP